MFEIMFTIVPILVLFIFVNVFVKIIKEWRTNSKSPRLKVHVKVVDKREHHSSSHHNHNGHMHTSSSYSYYITFEVESGDRMELRVPYNEFGLIVVGDEGDLSFQGTKFLSFERRY